MEELLVKSHGEVKKTSKWNTVTVTFNSGKEQKQRKQVSPDNMWAFTFSGLQKERAYFEDFFNARGGDYEPFCYTINGVKETVRFGGDSLEFTEIREFGKPVAYQAQVVLREFKGW